MSLSVKILSASTNNNWIKYKVIKPAPVGPKRTNDYKSKAKTDYMDAQAVAELLGDSANIQKCHV